MECWFRCTFLFAPLFIDFMLSNSTDNAETITVYSDSIYRLFNELKD